MKGYISIIYTRTNQLTAEKIAVGLIFLSDQKAEIKFSEKKLELVEKYFKPGIKPFIENQLHLFQNKIREINLQLTEKGLDETGLDKKYFHYLNKYSQGLFNFDELKPINLKLDGQILNELVDRFLDIYTEEKTKTSDRKGFVKFNTKKKLRIEPDDVRGVARPITLSGGYLKGKSIKLFKEIDLEKRAYYLINELYELANLKSCLSDHFSVPKKNIRVFLIPLANDSELVESAAYLIKNNQFEFVTSKEDLEKELTSIKSEQYVSLEGILKIGKFQSSTQ